MRFNFRRKSEPLPSSALPGGYWDEWTHLANQPLSEVSDPVEGRRLVVRKLGAPHVQNNLPEMLRLIAEGTRQFPQEPVLRLIAADAFRRAGDDAQAVAQLAIVLALAPQHSAAYVRLAQILNGRGEREAARGVLEAGWKHRQRAVRRSQRAADKAQYFSLVDFE
jgi:tetratricopeptide (TPR) repeat protein